MAIKEVKSLRDPENPKNFVVLQASGSNGIWDQYTVIKHVWYWVNSRYQRPEKFNFTSKSYADALKKFNEWTR